MKTKRFLARAITQSVQTDDLVQIIGDDEALFQLRALCADSAERAEGVEYWGVDEDGAAWRILVL